MSGRKKDTNEKKKQLSVSKSGSRGSSNGSNETQEPPETVKTPVSGQQDATYQNARGAIKATIGWLTEQQDKPAGLYGFLKSQPFDRPSENQKTYAFTANPQKNRNPNFPLFDKTRVRLKIEQESDNNYVNASHVSIPPCERKWIVSQHPMESFYEDFWKMVMYEEVDVIVAIFSPEENLPVYWPAEKALYANHGAFFVHCRKVVPPTGRNQATSYTIEVLPNGCSNARFVTLLHYPHWPKGHVAPSPKVVLKGIQALDPMTSLSAPKSKCLIHSTDGINRAMCFVMVDYMVELMFRNNTVDIPELVTQLRSQRGGAFHNRVYLLYAIFVVIDYVKIRLTKFKSAPEMLKQVVSLQKAMRKEFSDIKAKEPARAGSSKISRADDTQE